MNPYAQPDVRPTAQHHHRHHHRHHHQQSRYAHVSPSPRPPNRSSFPDSPIPYPSQTLHHYHHHHQHHQPTRHLPLPQTHHPPDYHPSPAAPRALTSPVPEYEFRSRGFNSIGDDRDRRLIYHHHQHHHHSTVASDRRVLSGHDSAIAENRSELLDRRMVHRQYSIADYNHDVHQRALDNRAASPYGPVDSSRRDAEAISRVRVRGEYGEGSGSRQQGNLLGSSWRFGLVAGSYDSEAQRNERGDSLSGRHSWVHKRENSRDSSDSLPEMTDFGVNDGEDIGTLALRQEHHGSEFGRYGSGNRVSREVGRDYSLTPKKHIQKKSAFLRLQAPRFNHRNKDNERHYSTSYDDENGSGSGSGSFKGKGQLQLFCSDHGPKDRGEDGSVDLDVSFKSNTLIAKPVVPSTIPGVVSEKDCMPWKLKSAIVSNKDSTGSLLDKFSVNDEKLNSSSSMSSAVISISMKSKQLHEGVGAVEQHEGSLGHLEGIGHESDGPAKSNSGPSPVPEVNNVSSATNEVGGSSLSPVVCKGSIDLQSSKDALPAGQDSKAGITRDVVFDKSENVDLIQGKTADMELLGKAPSVEDAVPEGQNSNAIPKSSVVSDKAGEKVGSSRGKTEDKGSHRKTHSFKDAVAEGQDSCAGAKRDMVSDKAGGNIYLSQGKTADKGLSGGAHPVKDTVLQRQDSCAVAKRNVVPPRCPKSNVASKNAGKSVGLSQGRTVKKGLPGKTPSFKDAVAEGQDSGGGTKKDVASHKAGENVGSSQGKTVKKRLPGNTHSVKDAVTKEQGSGVGTRKDAVSHKASENVGSSQRKAAEEGLPGKTHSVKDRVPERKDSIAGPKRGVVSDNTGKTGGSCQQKIADKELPDKAPTVKIAKKKKIVKRVVKRVITRKADHQNQQSSGKYDEVKKSDKSSRSESCKDSDSLQQEIASHSMAISEEHPVTHHPNESVHLQQIDQKNGLLCSISSPRYDQDTDEGIDVVFANKKDCVSSSLYPIVCEEKKVGAPNTNNAVDGSQIVSSCMKDLTVSLAKVDANISTDELCGQLPQDVKCALLENEAVKDNLAEDCNKTRMSNLSGTNIQDGSTVVDGSLLMRNAASGPEEYLIGSQDLPVISDKESVHAPECNRSAHQMTPGLCEDSQSVKKAGACLVSGSPTTNSEKISTSLSSVFSDDARGQLPQVGGPRMLNNGGNEDPGNFDQTMVDSKESALYAGRSLDRTSLVDSMTSREASICIKPAGKTCSVPAHVFDTDLNVSIQNPDPTVVSSSGGLTVRLPAITCGHTISHGADATNPCDTKVSVDNDNVLGRGRTSPVPRKRRKVCSAHPESSDATAPQDNDISFVADTTTFERLQSFPPDRSAQLKEAVPGPCTNALQGAASVSTPKESGVLLGDINQIGHSDATGVQVPGVHSSSFLGQSDVISGESLSNLIVECRPEENHLAVDLMHEHQDGAIHRERRGDKTLNLDHSEKQAMSELGKSKAIVPGISFQVSDQKYSPENIEYDASLSLKDDSPSVSSHVPFSGEVVGARDGVHTSQTCDEVMKSIPDALPDMASPESLPLSDAQISSGRALRDQFASEALVKNIGIDHEENLVGGGLSVSADFALSSVSHDNLVGYSSDHAVETSCLARDDTLSFPSNGSRSLTCSPNQLSTESDGRLNRQFHVILKASPSHSSFTSTTAKIASSNCTSRPNTWRRTSNSSATPAGIKPSMGTLPAKIPLPGKNPKFTNTSYIRKGNSLVRKPVAAVPQTQLPHSTVPLYRSNSLDMHDLTSGTGPGNIDDVNGMPNHLRTGVRNSPLLRPETSLLSISNDLPNCSAVPSVSLPCFQAASPPCTVLSGPMSDLVSSIEKDVLKKCEDVGINSETQQDQTVSIKSSGSRNEMEDGNLMISNLKKITYVKHKSNQLVAKVNDSDLPIHMVDEKQGLPSEGYYKRKRNQLILTSLDSAKQSLSGKANAEGQQGANIISSTSCGRRRSLKGSSKLQMSLKSALVWTLRGTSGNFNALNHQKVLPQLFPWKRATYRRNFLRNTASIGDNRALSAIRRLMLLRKRDTVYVRSSHGLSLRKLKVVSVGGCSLKWSKSMERQSKKASEEATRAVAAAEKKKRERNGAPLASVTKNKGERIFRIGNERYKMDASRKTLIRISDNETSASAASQQGTNSKKSYVPQRLVIDNDEYVRIGNGNQLVRDPKKRTRVLANEKVKWSLHTARLKLAKKRTYCQFFTRFGKCNKGDGKCPYIHDPSKIAVCTKFLSGSCSNKDCKLTHKVMPERMPDCSYFLQGLCTNKNCPYRHVNVNPNASTCEGFLRGYCADGDECRKKHSYVCPAFESTGSCPLGSKCKLHHPKSRTRGKKRKRSKEKKNTMGRYFGGSTYVRASDPGSSVTEKLSAYGNNGSNGNENPFAENCADYISLDVSDEGGKFAEEIGRVMGDEANDDFDMELDDLDALVKPIAIMNVMA